MYIYNITVYKRLWFFYMSFPRDLENHVARRAEPNVTCLPP